MQYIIYISLPSNKVVLDKYIYCTLDRNNGMILVNRHELDDSWFDFPTGAEIDLFSKTSRPALGFIQPPIQWLPGIFLGGEVPGA